MALGTHQASITASGVRLPLAAFSPQNCRSVSNSPNTVLQFSPAGTGMGVTLLQFPGTEHCHLGEDGISRQGVQPRCFPLSVGQGQNFLGIGVQVHTSGSEGVHSWPSGSWSSVSGASQTGALCFSALLPLSGTASK